MRSFLLHSHAFPGFTSRHIIWTCGRWRRLHLPDAAKTVGLAASWTAPGIEDMAIRSPRCTVFENRLDKSCPLKLNRHNLFNGIMIVVGCAHRIARPVAHSARPDEGHCAAFYYFRTPFLASPLGTSYLVDVRWTLAEVSPSRCRHNGETRGQLDRPGNRGYGDPGPTMHSF